MRTPDDDDATATQKADTAAHRHMAKWLQSGRRRDMCILLAGSEHGELTGQRLKTRLERRYDTRIEPKSFYGALDAMEDAGFVDRRTDGIAEKFSLTEAGERRLREQFQWMREQLDESE